MIGDHQSLMTTAEKSLHDTVKNAVDNKIWPLVKCLRGKDFMFKAAVITARFMEREEIECLSDPDEREKKCEEWASDHMLLVRHFLNKRRNYVSTEIGDLCVDVLLGGDGKGKMKKSRQSGRSLMQNSDQALDLSKPNNLKHPLWLPTPENIIDLVLRDQEAWGHNEAGELFDEAKQKKMDNMLAFHWDKIIHKVCSQQLWSPTKRCCVNMSTGGPNPSAANPKPGPHVTHSSEAIAVWMIENHYSRWEARAKFDVSHPEELKCKNPDGTFKEGIETLQGKCTCPSGGRQPHGGLTVAGKKPLLELIDLIKANRAENAEWIAGVEDRVRALVYKKNGRDTIDDKKKSRGKKKATNMANVDADEDDGGCDMANVNQW